MDLLEPSRDIIGGAAALLSTLLTVAFSWFKDRSTSALRLSKLDEASKRISFLESWLNVRTRVAPDEIGAAKPLVLEELDLAFREMKDLHAKARISPAAVSAQRRAQVGWFRRLFLLYSPQRKRAWVPRVLFYLVLIEAVAGPFSRESNMPYSDLVFFFLGVGVVAAICWAASVKLE